MAGKGLTLHALWQGLHFWQRRRGCGCLQPMLLLLRSSSFFSAVVGDPCSDGLRVCIGRSPAAALLRVPSELSSPLPRPDYSGLVCFCLWLQCVRRTYDFDAGSLTLLCILTGRLPLWFSASRLLVASAWRSASRSLWCVQAHASPPGLADIDWWGVH